MKNIKYILSAIVVLAFAMACSKDEIEIPFISISGELVQPSSFGSTDGAIDISVEGGVQPYQFFWSDGSTTEDVSGLPAGTYTVKIVDSESAVASKTYTLLQPDATPLDLGFTVSDVSYFGGDDGAIDLTIAGGTAPYTLFWSNGEETERVEDLSTGWYRVTVTDSGDPFIETVDSVLVQQPEFLCGRDSITDVDGNKYPTVNIGGQCWTTQNLRTEHLPENPMVAIEGRFCNDLNCTNAMGAHYTWDAAMNAAESAEPGDEVQGICPCEWHIPTKEEWEEFNAYLSVDGQGGSGINVPNKIRGEGSSSGFDALMAGNWGYSVFEGENGVFWTATEQEEGRAFYRLLNNFPLLGQGHVVKNSGLSVRCVKDRE
ncbi:MAG: hypothetical protein HRU12_15535 [Phaeodactylibacter sp.]|nr:hypothetical protein [Phaeodactylibacter sp.]